LEEPAFSTNPAGAAVVMRSVRSRSVAPDAPSLRRYLVIAR
jgi:hypothetical protein